MRIIIGVDGSAAARVACELVASRPWLVGTRVTLLAALEPVVDWTGLAPPSGEGVASEREALELVLEEHAELLRTSGLAVETSLEVGAAAELLMARANEEIADLIVVGSRGLGPISSTMLGSVSAHLVDHAACPVLVARLPHATRMLLASDGTTSSRDVPRCLAAWGNAFRGLPVEVLSVSPHEGVSVSGVDEIAMHRGIAEDVADELMELGWHAAATVRPGDPSREIVEEGESWHADLIVTGSRGIGTVRRLLTGSVAHDVLMHARASVLVMRGKVPAPLRRTADVTAAAPS
jgi:nucleotide-binding universal stress UspA family protein